MYGDDPLAIYPCLLAEAGNQAEGGLGIFSAGCIHHDPVEALQVRHVYVHVVVSSSSSVAFIASRSKVEMTLIRLAKSHVPPWQIGRVKVWTPSISTRHQTRPFGDRCGATGHVVQCQPGRTWYPGVGWHSASSHSPIGTRCFRLMNSGPRDPSARRVRSL